MASFSSSALFEYSFDRPIASGDETERLRCRSRSSCRIESSVRILADRQDDLRPAGFQPLACGEKQDSNPAPVRILTRVAGCRPNSAESLTSLIGVRWWNVLEWCSTYAKWCFPKKKPASPVGLTGRFCFEFPEREKRFELSTSTLARWHSTAELLPRKGAASTIRGRVCQA